MGGPWPHNNAIVVFRYGGVKTGEKKKLNAMVELWYL